MKIFPDVISDISIEKVGSVSTGDKERQKRKCTKLEGDENQNHQPQKVKKITTRELRISLKRIDLVHPSDGSPLNKIRGYFCHLCGGKKNSRSELYCHYSMLHYKEELMSLIDRETLQCQFCGYRRKNIQLLIPHLGSAHNKVEDFLPAKFHHPPSSRGRKYSKISSVSQTDSPELSQTTGEQTVKPSEDRGSNVSSHME